MVGSTDSVWVYLAGKYDANADGVIRLDEYGRDPGNFARLGRDGDGAIDRAELGVPAEEDSADTTR